MKARELERMVKKVGWIFSRQVGSHWFYVKPDDPKVNNGRPLCIPFHRGKDVNKFTAKAILKQAGIQ